MSSLPPTTDGQMDIIAAEIIDLTQEDYILSNGILDITGDVVTIQGKVYVVGESSLTLMVYRNRDSSEDPSEDSSEDLAEDSSQDLAKDSSEDLAKDSSEDPSGQQSPPWTPDWSCNPESPAYAPLSPAYAPSSPIYSPPQSPRVISVKSRPRKNKKSDTKVKNCPAPIMPLSSSSASSNQSKVSPRLDCFSLLSMVAENPFVDKSIIMGITDTITELCAYKAGKEHSSREKMAARQLKAAETRLSTKLAAAALQEIRNKSNDASVMNFHEVKQISEDGEQAVLQAKEANRVAAALALKNYRNYARSVVCRAVTERFHNRDMKDIILHLVSYI